MKHIVVDIKKLPDYITKLFANESRTKERKSKTKIL